MTWIYNKTKQTWEWIKSNTIKASAIIASIFIATAFGAAMLPIDISTVNQSQHLPMIQTLIAWEEANWLDENSWLDAEGNNTTSNKRFTDTDKQKIAIYKMLEDGYTPTEIKKMLIMEDIEKTTFDYDTIYKNRKTLKTKIW